MHERLEHVRQRHPGAIVLPFNGVWPTIDDSAFVAPGAVVIGNVLIGERASVWFNTTVRGDIAPITIGERSNVQDGTVVHVNADAPTVIGADVTIGHSALVHGTTIGDGTLVGMCSIVMSYSTIGRNVTIGAGALVPERAEIPDGAVMIGLPAQQRGELDRAQQEHLAAIGGRYVDVSRQYRAELMELFASVDEVGDR